MIPDDQKLHLTDNHKNRHHHRVVTVATIAACILITGLLSVATCYTYLRLQHLEDKVQQYQALTLAALRNISDDSLSRLMQKFDNEENYGDGNLEYEYEDDDEDDDDDGDDGPQLGGDFTKDRVRRDVVAATQDGIPIDSESYAHVKRKNNTLRLLMGSTDDGSALEATTPPTTVYHRKSRVMHQDDTSKAFRRVVLRSMLKSTDASGEFSGEAPNTIRHTTKGGRRNRHRLQNLEESFEEVGTVRPRQGRIKPLPSIRVDGDTSKYVMGQHDNFNGNGHMRHPRKTYVDWKSKPWVSAGGMSQHYGYDDGGIKVMESGMYFIYAQIYYLDEHDTNGYRIYRNDEETLLQCTTSTHTAERRLKGNTCFTAGADYLNEGDVLTVADLADGRYSLFEPGKSFFGVVKLGDMRVK